MKLPTADADPDRRQAVRDVLATDGPWWTLVGWTVRFVPDHPHLGGIIRGTTAEIWGPYVPGTGRNTTRWAVAHELGHAVDRTVFRWADRQHAHTIMHRGVDDGHLASRVANLPTPPGRDHAPHGWTSSGRTPHGRAAGEAWAEWFAWRQGFNGQVRYGEHDWADRDVQAGLEALLSDRVKEHRVFDDVDPASTHAEAIHALAAAGILGGRGDGSFGPNEPVTRAQLATILYNAGIGRDNDG